MTKKVVFRFIMGPVAKIRAVGDAALPAFTKFLDIHENFILKVAFLLLS
jgi:hypothetical protein